MRSRRQVFFTADGTPWGLDDLGGFWGPYSQRPDHPRHYFGRLIKALLDGGAFWDRFHRPPAGYPFPLLGQPCAQIQSTQMTYPHEGLDLLLAPVKLEYLTQRLQLLRREQECFRVLAEVNAPEPRP